MHPSRAVRHLVCLAPVTLLTLAPACTPKSASAPPPVAHNPGLPAPAAPVAKPDGKPEAPKWTVDDPPGEEVEVAIDVREGTWISLDVSPDGSEIVFDLLGDLYSLPIAGGEAKALTSGIAWDMQPRFSPDGKWIAFTSDRGGGDNVWVIPRAGGEARQITKEDFRLVNSPVWSPDGNFIAVRKHFTKHRSLGAGEIWLYHVSGGKGLQMTEKPNDQQDVGEPAFSPDGKYVYFSQDVTPGPYFQYNKDPYDGIYAIRRLERSNGRVEVLIGGAGGAARPTPSHDGKLLAYVRRVGATASDQGGTTLYVRELASGQERPVARGLDRDNQETWAIHGVYPAMAFTPDDKAIVYWAGGKLNRVELASGKTTPIEFHVKTTRKVAPAVRFPVKVAPAEFPVKMTRWPTTSPDGKTVVFQALGKLYVKTLPDGQPKRLTTQEEHVELYPTFSRDGKTIVYTTWDDQAFGSVRAISAKGGKSRVLTQEPGHYIEPAVAPDGKTVVYRKVAGGYTRSPAWSQELGLYAVPLKGGPAQRVTREGEAPHFGADSERVFFTHETDDKVQLWSVELGGSEARPHASTELATAFRVSPDGQWIAWQEGFQAHIAPFPATGRTIELGPKMDAVPAVKVSKDAGNELHWSGDSQRLHWSLGPTLYTRELKDAFAFMRETGKPQQADQPLPDAPGVEIGFTAKTARPQGTVALVGVRAITMKGEEVIEPATIVIENDRIKAIGPEGQVAVPAGARKLELRGATVIPGLVDVHAHGSAGEQGIVPEQNWHHLGALAFGVTTLHDPSNETGTIFAASELQKAGLIVAPRIFSTGTILYGALAPFKANIDSLDDARSHLRRMKAVGAFSVKSYNQPRREQRQQVLAAARELEMMVVPEGGSLYHHNMTMVVDGHTGVEHAMPIGAVYADTIQLWSGTKVGYTPTLGVAYGGLGGEFYWYANTEVAKNKTLAKFVPKFVYAGRAYRRVTASEGDWNHVRAAQIAKKLADAGVGVNLGAHGQREGLAAHWELWMLVQGGMTPMEALRAGTINGARYLGLDADLGSLEVGKLADLAILANDPRAEIRNTDSVTHVVVGGRVFDASTMREIGGLSFVPQPFFWTAAEGAAGGAAPAHSHCSH